MVRRKVQSGLGLIALLGVMAGSAVAVRGYAEDRPAKADKAEKGVKRKELRDDKKKAELASKVDFAAALDLDLQGLSTLGTRIDEARLQANPIALILLGKELGAMEEVSGKKASLTAAKLLEEGREAVGYRNQPAELRTAAKLLGKDAAAQKLVAQADAADKAGEERAKPKTAVSKGITEYLTVNNHTKWYIRVYVNGYYKGVMAPYDSASVYVGDGPYDTTKLYAYAPGTTYSWGPRYVTGAVGDFAWNLY